MAIELDIKPRGAMREEQYPIDVNRYEKLVSVLQEEILIYVGKEKHLVRRGDSVYFASNISHYFENPSKKIKARCVIVQNPKSY